MKYRRMVIALVAIVVLGRHGFPYPYEVVNFVLDDAQAR